MSQLSRADRDPLAVPAVTARMTESEVRMLVLYVMRVPAVFTVARVHLQTGLFSPVVEGGALLVVQALFSYHDRYGTLPAGQLLVPEIDRAASSSTHLSATAREWAADTAILADDANLVQVLQADPNPGLDLLHRFLSERLVSAALTQAVRQTPGHLVLSQVDAIVDRLTGLMQQVNTVRTRSAVPLFDGLDERIEMPRIVPTGVPFLDDQILAGGGQAGKTYGLFGPFGSFKTGLGVQIAVCTAERQLAEEDPGLVAYFVYEGGAREIRIRAMAAAALISKRTIEDYMRFGNTEDLSTANSLKPYEQARYDRLGTPPNLRLGEVERLEQARHRLNNFYIKDMSGPANDPSAGSGYVTEIAATVERLTRETGRPVRSVVVDYVKQMVRRHQSVKKGRPEDLRHLMSEVPDLIRRTVADKYQCSVWLLQQLNPQANRKAAGAAQHHADSSEAGDFAENLWYAITLSSVDRANNNSIQLTASKTRDTDAPATGLVVRIDGDSSRLVENPDVMVGTLGRLVSRNIHQAMVGPTSQPQPQPTAPRRPPLNTAAADD